MNPLRGIISTVGSLWFAAVLLVLLLFALACATVYDSTVSPERALVVFYHSRWFAALLALLAVNLLASVAMRYPFRSEHVGFLLTHLGIVVTLAGALVTREFGIDAQVSIAEGQTVSRCYARIATLELMSRQDQHAHAAVELTSSDFDRLKPVDDPSSPVLKLALADDETIEVKVIRFLPDSVGRETAVNDNPRPQPAVQVSATAADHGETVWVFANRPARLFGARMTYRVAPDEATLQRLLNPPPPSTSKSKGNVKISYEGRTYEVPLEQCIEKAVPVGETGFTLRVLRYLPHATVGADNKLTSLSNEPVNPAIEAELVGPNGTERRISFAKYPDFESTHGGSKTEGLKLTFVSTAPPPSSAPIEILTTRGGAMYVRFSPPGRPAVVEELSPGEPVDTSWPWQGHKLTVLQRLDNARRVIEVEPVTPVRDRKEPAIRLQVVSGEHTSELWVSRYRPYPLSINGRPYQLIYGDKAIDLGFDITLERFVKGVYPGGRRDRTFESVITLTDRTSGAIENRVVSMNNPVKFGGFALFQSSYRQTDGKWTTVLSVARDPGTPIVYVGYVATILGMIVVLIRRMSEANRRPGGAETATATADAAAKPPSQTRSGTQRIVQLTVGGK